MRNGRLNRVALVAHPYDIERWIEFCGFENRLPHAAG